MSTILQKLFNKDKSSASSSNNISKILLFGTGGGSDILSALLFAAIIRNRNDATFYTTDLAGMLSPGSKHYYNSELEKVVNRIKRPNKEIEKHSPVRRFIGAYNEKEISFVDAHIWFFIDEFNKLLNGSGLRTVNVENVYNFSTKFKINYFKTTYSTSKFVSHYL
jgi:hypothetical protein